MRKKFQKDVIQIIGCVLRYQKCDDSNASAIYAENKEKLLKCKHSDSELLDALEKIMRPIVVKSKNT